MSLIELSIRKWQLTAIFSLLAAALGLQALLTTPRSVDPHFPIPNIIITAVLPGADPLEMEESVAKPIEEAVQGIDRIKEVRSSSTSGVSVIVAEFDHGSDADQSLDRVVRDVGAIRNQLPSGIVRVDFRRARPTEAAIMQLAVVSSSASWQRLEKYGRDIRDRLNVVQGIRSTTIFGLPRTEMRVSINEARLRGVQISPLAVSAAVSAGGAQLVAGAVDSDGRRLNLDSGGAYRSINAISDEVIRSNSGRIVQVGDVADVEVANAERLHITRFNGKRALFLAVKQKDGFNGITLRDALRAEITTLRETLPPDIALETAFDQTVDIDRRLGQLGTDFVIALGLVLVTLIPLGKRAAVVVMVSIPLSLAMGVFILSQLGYTLNQISISGFIIALGLLVDDSIVVTENIERRLREGLAPLDAALAGTREVAVAVSGSTGVLIFAFLPLAFLPESAGDFVRGLPVTVLATVSSSLLVSLTVIPFLASRVLKSESGADGNRALQALTQAIERFYQPILRLGLSHPHKTVWGSMLVCFGAMGLLSTLGTSLFPISDSPYFLVKVETPEGSNIAKTDTAVRDVSAMLKGFPDIANRIENVGRGNPQVFYNSFPREDDTRYGEIFVTLDRISSAGLEEDFAALQSSFDRYPDAKVNLTRFENGPPIDAPVAIRLRGPDIETLRQQAEKVAAIMRKTSGLRDIDNPLAVQRVGLDITVDSGTAGLLGVTANDIRRALRIALAGEQAAVYRDSEGDALPVVVRLPMNEGQPVSALDQVSVTSQSGAVLPLSQVAQIYLNSGPAQVNRYLHERTVVIKAYNEPDRLPSELSSEVKAKMAELPLPEGYFWNAAGAEEVAKRSTDGLGRIILLALFGIFAVLVAEFGRFKDVLVVAGVIPLGLLGGIIALFITGNSLSFLSIIGFIALIGIEIKNSILLVDFTTSLRAEGFGLLDAIQRAGEIRFLPVLLTSVTAIGGLMPLALSGSPLYSPLAWVIIGGLASSTMLSRVVVPTLYFLLAKKDE